MLGSVADALDPDNWMPGGRQAAFTLALVALSAKMAVADGVVTLSEIDAFRKIIRVPDAELPRIERFFSLAQQDVAGFKTYARKVARLFEDSPDTLQNVLEGLFSIAAADGMIHENELDYLKQVSNIFGFSEEKFEQISALFLMEKGQTDPYLILGISPDASDDIVRGAYRRLVLAHHPDRLLANGVPEELADMGSDRISAINVAYGQIAKSRKL